MNATSFDSLAPIVTLAVFVPNFSCQASIVYVPGGRPLSWNEPSAPVTAKKGWSTTPTNEFIQRCTSHLKGTITSRVLKTCVSFMPCSAWPLLNSALACGHAWMLCSVASLLRISIGWPTCTPKTWGRYWQPFWSSTSGVPGIGNLSAPRPSFT